MKRVAILSLIATLAACGSGSDSSGPTDKFTGTWSGQAISGNDTLTFEFLAVQTGSTVSGTGNESEGSVHAPYSFTGTSTPPNVSLILDLGTDLLSYNGSYTSGNGISGVVANGDTSLTLNLVKQ